MAACRRSDCHRGGRILGAEDGRARDKAVHPGHRRLLDGVFVDAAVDLHHDGQLAGIDQTAGDSNLGQHLGDELLPAEPRFDRHDQQGVELAQDLQVRLQRGAGFDAQTGLGAGGADVAGHADRVVGRLGMEGDVVGAGLGVRGRPAVRVVDHQMAVHRDVGRLQQRLDHRQPDGQVRYEVVVHHVDVQPVGAGHHGGFVGQPGEVGGQDRRRYQRGWTCLFAIAQRSSLLRARRRTSHRCRAGAATTARRARRRGRRPDRTTAGCPARSPGGDAARRRPRRRSRPDAVSTSRTAPHRRAGSAGSPTPAVRAAVWPAPAHRRADGANGPRAGVAARPARCTARRRAPGRSRVAHPDRGRRRAPPRPRRPRVFSSTSSARRALGSTAVTRAPAWRADRGQQRGLAARPGAQIQPAAPVGRRPAPTSAPGPPVGCPRPAPAPGRRGPARARPGHRRTDRRRRANSGRACR